MPPYNLSKSYLQIAILSLCRQLHNLPPGDRLNKICTRRRALFQPMTHSSNPVSGGLWNGAQAAYWDSQVSACYYCHGETLHDTDPLGNVSNIKAGNALNQSVTNTSFWCANCHYQNVPSGKLPYNGNILYSRTT